MSTFTLLAAATASTLLVGSVASADVVTPFVGGDFESVTAPDGTGLTGLTLDGTSGFAGFTLGGDANFDSTFLFFGDGASLAVNSSERLPVTPDVEYNLQFDTSGFGGDPEVFLLFEFFDASGTQVGASINQSLDLPDGFQTDFNAPSIVAPTGAATVGFTLFGAGGAAVDNLELVAVPEPSLMLGGATASLLALRRRQR